MHEEPLATFMSLLISAVVSLAPSAKRISELWCGLRGRLCSLFDCFSAAKPMSTPPDALRGGPDLIYGSYLAAKPMCAPPDALRPIVLSTVSQHLQPFPEPSPSPVERESPSCRVSARSTVTELTPLSGKSRFQAPLPAQRYSKPPR